MSNSNNKRGRPRKQTNENKDLIDIYEEPKDIKATITEVEKTLDESIHEILYYEIPNEQEKHLTDTLLDIILNEPKLKESIMNKIENKDNKKGGSTYTEAQKRALQKYREKNRAKYNESQKKVYERIKNDEERKEQHNKISRDNQRKYAEIRKQERIARGETIRPRGRPKKLAQVSEPEIKNGDNV